MRLHRRVSGEARSGVVELASAGAGDVQSLQEAIEFLPVGVVVEDNSGRLVAANRRARSPFNDLTADALAEAALERAIVEARLGRARTEVLDLHGPRPRRLEVTASPLSGGGLVAVAADVSDRLRLEAVRRDFVANVNHELRTPIGALGVLAEALAGERDPATIDRLVGRMSAEVERALALIEDLLDFSRVESEDQPAHSPVLIDEIVRAAISRVGALAEQENVDIVVSPASSDAVVDGDRRQLVMALANLLDNAVKYSDPGTTVTVAVSTGEAAVNVAVADQGIGIPARDLDRIFERFYRVDSARDRRTGGTGLGLAIVRHVAQNHGGSVSVESEEGVGSTFTLTVSRPAAGSAP